MDKEISTGFNAAALAQVAPMMKGVVDAGDLSGMVTLVWRNGRIVQLNTIGKRDMIHNSATPNIQVDPETYEVRADGELLTCEPAQILPLAQRYFLF